MNDIEISKINNTCREYVGDELVDVNIAEYNNERVLLYSMKCQKCGKIYGKYTYVGRSLFLCDECYKEREKRIIEQKKAKEKELEKKIMNKCIKKIPKIREKMCRKYCVMPILFADDEDGKRKSCANCPLFSFDLEGGGE